MTRYLADTATVMTGESSLRNLAYEPSQQGSGDEESTIHTDDGESVLSSVLSSVKRGLQNQKMREGTSTQSLSTRQSEGLLWQDTETEVELYDTDEEEQDQSMKSRTSSSRYSQQTTSPSVVTELSKSQSVVESQYLADELSNTLDSTMEDVKSQDSSVRSKAASESMVSHLSYVSKRSMKSRDSKSSKKSSKSEEASQKGPARSSKRKEPMKRLRFSKETVAEVVHSRHHTEDRHTSRRPQKQILLKLENVEYVSRFDVASTNQDLSTVHPLGKEDCGEVFKDRVPFEVPVSQPSTDDMSSIHALSTRVPIAKPSKQVEAQIEENITEERSVVITIPDVQEETLVETMEDEDVALSGPRMWLQLLLADRSSSEIFFATLAGVSLITLVILVMILLAL